MTIVASINEPKTSLVVVDHARVSTTFVLPRAGADHIQKHIASTGTFYEQELLEHMRARVAPDQLVLDVGACIGNHTLFLANICKARVIALEPNGEAFSTLRQNIEINDLAERVVALQMAAGASASTGTLVLDATGENMGMTRVDGAQPGNVRICRIDDLDLSGRLVAIKVDVEGMELDVLRGATATLTRERPLLYIEASERNSLASVAEFLSELGYSANAQFNATTTVLFRPIPAGHDSVNQQLALQHHESREHMARARTALGSLLKRTHDEGDKTRAALDKQRIAHDKQQTVIANLASTLSKDNSHHQQALDSILGWTATHSQATTLLERRAERIPELEKLARESVEALRVLHSQVLVQTQQLKRVDEQLTELHRATTRARQQAARSHQEILRSNETWLRRFARKTRKLVRSPEAFFADSQSDLARVHLKQLHASAGARLLQVTPAPMRSKLTKLQRDPDSFFRDSKHYAIHTLARNAYAAWAKPVAQTQGPGSAQTKTPAPSLHLKSFDQTVFSVIVVMEHLADSELALLAELSLSLGPTDELVIVTRASRLDRDLPRWSQALKAGRARTYLCPAGVPPDLLSYALDRALGQYCVVLEALSLDVLKAVQRLSTSRTRPAFATLRTRTSHTVVGMGASRDVWREARLKSAHGALSVMAEWARGALEPVDMELPERTEPPAEGRTLPSAEGQPIMFCPRGREGVFCETLVGESDTVLRWMVVAADAKAFRSELDQVGLMARVTVVDASESANLFVFPMPAADTPFKVGLDQQATAIVCLERRSDLWFGAADKLESQRELVSVVMTLYNAESTVEAAIASVLHQSYAHLELIVVDDCSQDTSLARVQRIAKHDRRVRVLRSPRNMGTYWCKNLGLMDAKGHYVTFQDADDFSLAARLELQVATLRALPRLAGCVASYQRLTETGEIKWIGGHKDRRARITLMLRRRDLARFGFFDSVRMSADDELLQRIAATGGKIARIPGCYYVARHAAGSLTTSGVGSIEATSATNGIPVVRSEYLAAASAWHRRIATGASAAIEFPVRQRPFSASAEIGADRSCEHEFVTASLATMPSRVGVLETTIRSLLPQVDRLNVYLNCFETVPEFLRHDKIHIARSQDFGDLKDNGKFFFARDLARGYHLTVDDDIAYPSDYVRRLILAVERYGRRAAVGVHGVIFDPELKRYTKGRSVFHFKDELEGDRFVALLGTGTVAYHTSTLTVDHTKYESLGVADLWFAAQAKDKQVPLVSVARPQNWLRPLEHQGPTIFAATSRDDSAETVLARKLGPWTDEAFDGVRRPLVETLSQGSSLRALRASGYDIHEMARARGIPPIHIVLIVTGWNCAEYVRACFRSIVKQQRGQYTAEVIVVDDGSDDQTWSALSELEWGPSTRLRRHEVNAGPAFSRWEAIREITDPQAVCVLLDMDDELFPSALAAVAEAYLANEQCWLTTGNWRNQNGKSNPLDFYPESIVQARAYRKVPSFRFGHVRSFRRFLADVLTDDMFKGPDGEWLMFCTDVALMFPLAEQCAPENIEALRGHHYLYNERRPSGTLQRFGKPRKREVYGWLCKQKPLSMPGPSDAEP